MPALRRLWFRPQAARRYQPEHFLQGLRPGVQRLAGPTESVFRPAHWPPTTHVTFGIIMRVLSRGGAYLPTLPRFPALSFQPWRASSAGPTFQSGPRTSRRWRSHKPAHTIPKRNFEIGQGEVVSLRGEVRSKACLARQPTVASSTKYHIAPTGPKRAGTVTVRSNTKRSSHGPLERIRVHAADAR